MQPRRCRTQTQRFQLARCGCAAVALLALCTSCAGPQNNRSTAQNAAATEEKDVETVALPPNAPPTPRSVLNEEQLAEAERRIVGLTNDFRREQGRPAVRPDRQLRATAEAFAQYMARTSRYGHTADGREPADRAKAQGYDYCLVSENIAYQYNSAGFETGELARAFTQGWINSPGHRKNMMDPDVVHTGVAIARSDNGTYYAVQLFGRPESMRIDFRVANHAGRDVTYTLDGESFTLPSRTIRTHGVCRPPELRLKLGSGNGDEKLLRPADGSAYAIQPTSRGGLRVEEQGR